MDRPCVLPSDDGQFLLHGAVPGESYIVTKTNMHSYNDLFFMSYIAIFVSCVDGCGLFLWGEERCVRLW